MGGMIKGSNAWVVFDADNTLWAVEHLYDAARQKMCEYLGGKGITRLLRRVIKGQEIGICMSPTATRLVVLLAPLRTPYSIFSRELLRRTSDTSAILHSMYSSNARGWQMDSRTY